MFGIVLEGKKLPSYSQRYTVYCFFFLTDEDDKINYTCKCRSEASPECECGNHGDACQSLDFTCVPCSKPWECMRTQDGKQSPSMNTIFKQNDLLSVLQTFM